MKLEHELGRILEDVIYEYIFVEYWQDHHPIHFLLPARASNWTWLQFSILATWQGADGKHFINTLG